MSKDKKIQSQAEVRQHQLDAYNSRLARTFLDSLIIPMIRRECKVPTQDVTSSPEMQFLVSSVLGSQAQVRSGKANLPN